MNPTEKQHGILCGVTSCEYQQGGGCSLQSIAIQPCSDATSQKKEDQSTCTSFKSS